MLIANMAWIVFSSVVEEQDWITGAFTGAFNTGVPTVLGLIAALVIGAVLGIA